MRRFKVSIGTTGVPAPYYVDPHITPVNLGVGVYVTSVGGANYSVQHTFDDPFERKQDGRLRWSDPTVFVSGARWINHSTLTSLTSTADSNYAYPPNAVRLVVNSIGSGETVEMIINQAG